MTLLLPEILPAQQFNLRTYTTTEGLANNNVREIAIDSSGFLWAATWDGLSRYDGYEFKNYYHIPGDSTSLPYFALRDIAVDGANNLWIVSDQGQLALFDRINDNFTRVREIPLPKDHIVVNMDVDNNGNLWIIGEKGIFVERDYKTGNFKTYNVYEEESTDFEPTENFKIYVINEKEIWLSGNNLYHLINRSSDKDKEQTFIVDIEYKLLIAISPYMTDYFDRAWSRFYISPAGNKWVFSNFGLYRQDKDGEFKEFRDAIPEGEFTGDRLFIWESPGKGVFIYNPSNGLIENIIDKNLKHFLTSMAENKDVVWFSARTAGGNSLGMVQVIASPVIFRNYQAESGIASSDAVYSIYKYHSGVIWTGIRGRDYIHIINPDGTTGRAGVISSESGKFVGHLRAIAEVKNGLWLGYFSNRLLFYDFPSKTYKKYSPDPPGHFQTILPDKDGNLLIATNNIYKLNPGTGKSVILWRNNLGDFPIYKLVRDSSGILWAGSWNYTLIKINPADWSSENIQLSEDAYNLEDICPGDNNDFWIASLGGGVCHYAPLTGEKKFYTTSDGLSNNTTYSILRDKSGYIWVSTNNGISRINPQTGRIRIFNKSDGLNIVEFNSDASFKAEDGEFLFGGVGGIAGFYPDSIQNKGTTFGKQKVLITGINVSGIPRHFKKPVYDADTIILKKGEDDVRISFSSTDFVNSEKTKYRYLMQGIITNWVETNYRDRAVNFANLRPGWYDFAIQATDGNGKWSASKTLKIRVMPYFYQTRSFTVVFPLFIIAVIALSIILYIRNLRRVQGQKLDALRLQTLQGQMNPHFVFNSLNSINYFISNNDKLSANRYIADFSKLIRSILYNMNHDFITLDKEIESLSDYLKIEYLRFGDKFDYEIILDPQVEADRFRVSPGLIQPFIENAIWHGMRGLDNRKGMITLKFTKSEGNTICTVEDDGIGRKKAEAMKSEEPGKKSHGISIVLERLKIINNLMGTNYQVHISDCCPDLTDTGTRVIIELPIISN